MADRTRAVLGLVLSAALVVLSGCSGSSGLLSNRAPDGFVTRSGTTLEVDGEPFRFVGFNLHDAAASDIYSCAPQIRPDDEGLDETMAQIRDSGGTVVRFWVFQPYTAGGTDFEAVDRVIAAAKAHGLKVFPSLEDGPGNCSTGERGVHLSRAGNGQWYSEGYRVPYGDATISFRDYAVRVARHYRDEPAIIGWSLMNEAETTERDDEGRTVLVDFARDMASRVRAVDPNHLITLGTQSNGAPGVSGADFLDVYSLPGLDFTEVHDWGHYGSDTEAMPGAADDGSLPAPEECQALDAEIACAFTLARELDKPLVVGEAGIAAHTAEERDRRAVLLEAKIDAALADGASGYLVWQLSGEDPYVVVPGSDDPLFEVMRRAGESLRSRD